MWLNEVHKILTQSGGMRSERVTRPGQPSSSSAVRPAPPPPVDGSISGSLKRSIDILMQGHHFYMYDEDASKQVILTEVFLFYQHSPQGLGCLRWCDPNHGRVEVPANILQLANIREMTAGKQVFLLPSRSLAAQRDLLACYPSR